MIIDNFLNKEEFNVFKNIILGEDFPWFYNDKKVKIGIEDKKNFQFTHLFFSENNITSSFYPIVYPILKKLNANALSKIKANLTIASDKAFIFGLHTDTNVNCKTAIYYLNNNNGKTVFENKEEVNSVENRIVIFNSNIKHSAISHTNENRRVVLNINFI
jgi:hypothetical protein